MEQEVKINALEIMIKLARLQSDINYIKEHLIIPENSIDARKKEIFANYKKKGSITDEEWEFCKKIDWHPVDELPPKKEHVEELRRRLKDETPVRFDSINELNN